MRRSRKLTFQQALLHLKQPGVTLLDTLLGTLVERNGEPVAYISHAAGQEITPYIELLEETRYGRRFKIKDIFLPTTTKSERPQ